MLTKYSRMQIKRVVNLEFPPLFVWNDLIIAFYCYILFGRSGTL